MFVCGLGDNAFAPNWILSICFEILLFLGKQKAYTSAEISVFECQILGTSRHIYISEFKNNQSIYFVLFTGAGQRCTFYSALAFLKSGILEENRNQNGDLRLSLDPSFPLMSQYKTTVIVPLSLRWGKHFVAGAIYLGTYRAMIVEIISCFFFISNVAKSVFTQT